MGAGPSRVSITGSTAMRTRPARAIALATLAVVAVAVAEGRAASRPAAGVPSATECRRLLARAPAPEPSPPASRGRLLDKISQFVESAPDGQRYVFPTGDERARFQCGFQYAVARQLERAARLLQPLGYDVSQLVDTGAPVPRRLVLFEERKSRGQGGVARYRRGWGLFVIAPRTAAPLVAVEVPHPCKSTARCSAVGGDRRTHTMAVTTFERASAKYLFVAGTDRGAPATGCPDPPCSADAAHEPASMFEAVHEAALAPRLSVPAATRIYQPHGFLTTNHPPSCQEVVVSAGLEQNASPGAETTRLARLIAAALNIAASDVYGGKVLLYGRDIAPPGRRDGRVDCSPEDDPDGGLGATTNVQGRFAARLTPARDFVSVEASENVRNVAAERDALSDRVGVILSRP
jgi:hypothetical protein